MNSYKKNVILITIDYVKSYEKNHELIYYLKLN